MYNANREIPLSKVKIAVAVLAFSVLGLWNHWLVQSWIEVVPTPEIEVFWYVATVLMIGIIIPALGGLGMYYVLAYKDYKQAFNGLATVMANNNTTVKGLTPDQCRKLIPYSYSRVVIAVLLASMWVIIFLDMTGIPIIPEFEAPLLANMFIAFYALEFIAMGLGACLCTLKDYRAACDGAFEKIAEMNGTKLFRS